MLTETELAAHHTRSVVEDPNKLKFVSEYVRQQSLLVAAAVGQTHSNISSQPRVAKHSKKKQRRDLVARMHEWDARKNPSPEEHKKKNKENKLQYQLQTPYIQFKHHK